MSGDRVPLAWCPHHQQEFTWLLVGTPTTASPEGKCRWLGTPQRAEPNCPHHQHCLPWNPPCTPCSPCENLTIHSRLTLTSHTHISHLTWINPEFPPLILRLYPESAPGLYFFTIYPRYPTTQSLIHYFNMAWNITF